MSVQEKISALVKNQFPDFYKEEGENFLAFIQAYYEYMEQNGKLTDAVRNLESYRDINTTLDEYLEYFRKDLLPSIPTNVQADKRLLAKYIKYFNQTRGTLASYKLLFRAIYNEDVEVNYPADQILKVSDGDWKLDRYLVTSYNPSNYRLIGRTIRGSISSAEALVEDVVRKMVNGRDLQQIVLSNIKGRFTHLENISDTRDFSTPPYSCVIEAGVRSFDIESAGGQFKVGDEAKLVSDYNGDFGKAIVTGTVDLGDIITFSIIDGGSGYIASTEENGTTINITGGDGTSPASFVIRTQDIVDPFSLSTNINFISSNNLFGELAPTIGGLQMYSFANTLLSSPRFGFPETTETVGAENFYDQANALINIATTEALSIGQPIYGQTTGANGTIISINDNTVGDGWFKIDGYKKFQVGETLRVGNATTGNVVGTVSEFQGNTVGYHVVQIGNTSPINIGDEIVGLVSNAYGVVKDIVEDQANGYTQGVGGADDRNLLTLRVAANTTANLTSQFDTGPLKRFVDNESIRIVGSTTSVGNVASVFANTLIENIYTPLQDCLLFNTSTFGTIAKLSLPVGGAGFSIAPTVTVRSENIVSLGIGEAYLTLQSNDVNWSTGNSAITRLDTTDRIVQASTGASADVHGVVLTQIDDTYQMVVRVWQDFNQREPGNINWANNDVVTIQIYDGSYVPGGDDNRVLVANGTAKIVSIDDRGILGENAVINASVGADGTITTLRILDSGFSYKQNERVLLEAPDRENAINAVVRLNLSGAANSEGYYSTTRGHVSSTRSYLQDSDYYQEYSYEIISPISFDRYKDIALKLVHPAGQKLFGKFRQQTNAYVDVVASSVGLKKYISNGTIALTNGSFDVVGTGTSFLSEFANNGTIIIEYAKNQFYTSPINIVVDNETANLHIAWANSDITSANAYYTVGSIF